jgi:multicomponent Na+:H+ antiporter subunit D
MSALLPIACALPLLGAPLVAGAGHWLPRRAADVAGILVATATAVLAAVVLARSFGGLSVYWFGGWRPREGVALGISFAVDPLGAGIALLAAVLVTIALVYSWRYFEEVGTLFHVLVLLFLGGAVGFSYTGDVFNMFVFLELMCVAAFALTAFRTGEEGPIEGAFNFAVTNTLGALLILFGIGLLYGRTGALNLAQMGRALEGRKPDGLVVVAFALLVAGFLVKAGAAPFHFWLSDAYAVAPAPVCVLFAGVMTEFGVFGLVRVFWTVFALPLDDAFEFVRWSLVGVGVLTAIVGALMAFLQRHVKRMLAFSSIAYTGIFLICVGTLTPDGLAAAGLLVIAHGLSKGALFLGTGVMLERMHSVDELALRGRGRRFWISGPTWLAAAVALASPPFIGGWQGHEGLDHASSFVLGRHWTAAFVTAVTVVSTGAILRAGARVFLGWGDRQDPLLSPEPDEEPEGEPERPALLLALPAAALAATALALGAIGTLTPHALRAAEQFTDTRAYASAVLDGRATHVGERERPPTSAESVAWAVVATGGALGLAAFGLWRRRVPRVLRAGRLLVPALDGLRGMHTGHVGDYVAWLTFGTAALGGLFAIGITAMT